jgi:hypothetical protein
MKYYDVRTVEFDEDVIKVNENSEVVYHPLNRLYYLRKKTIPENLHQLAFAGNDLFNTDLFKDVRYYYLGFYGEMNECRYREAWADKLRDLVLQRLVDKDKSWYISFASPQSCTLYNKESNIRVRKKMDYYRSMNPNRTAMIRSEQPYGYGKGEITYLFVEISKKEIYSSAIQIWSQALEMYPIQGYCLPKDSIYLLNEWNSDPRDHKLFRKVLNACDWIFFASPAEHWYFEFFTNKYGANDFLKRIDLEDLNVRANCL